MDDHTHRRWDIRHKLLLAALTALGLLLGAWQAYTQFQHQHQLRAERVSAEFNKRQLEAYVKVSSVIGRVASGTRSKDQLLKDFDEFYSVWGEVRSLEDDDVAKASLAFRVEIHNYRDGIVEGTERLEVTAANLMNACRAATQRMQAAQSK
jgi:hypothetical protein